MESVRRVWSRGNFDASSGIDEKLDELHRVLMFFVGLLVEVPGEKGSDSASKCDAMAVY